MAGSADGFSAAEVRAMRRALELAATPGVPLGPNPRVGCVLLDADGREVAAGFHRGAGTPHAEVAALAEAGADARGTTAVVTLEPCNHTGRTGPCSTALIESGVARVVYAQPDPNPLAAGGAEALRRAGVAIGSGLLEAEARRLNRAWIFALEHQRPFVTWKFATSLDGRSAAADGTSRWVSSRPARIDTHRLRGQCDVMLVGANTVAVDDPELTVRDEYDVPLARQPLRAVMGERDLPDDRRIFNDRAPTVRLRTHDPRAALAQLFDLDRRHVFLEGGPTLAASFLVAGLVDEVVTYVAPILLGAGRSAVGDLGISTIADALHLTVTDVTTLGTGADTNVRITMEPAPAPDEED
ncbi:bifunctional diaminohydroxyphosphoribosylaminopyrimidine deaminase/5-amino-6-(5-phosphoribosylamino)uracil reductase RibD [Nocardioides terrisoli]|uniref:bifunctional diaminohydroxyphosphoribosylaminopyrimidine deaminase/5-amino-6-(5-phosphoribosylamino)uracil reductase RibD n=1 Tax=Nocardioides terrisoli TaxID=3388267 RepID=UPI00287B7ED1|nr:bifunctional diaminohydroxyphosphoribosylaminopyrimidine deaminase/5-amino-6-(5-phosphoribosylamino)uracil reductase RibD [Nocardioides marmorisolisilvae]